jgi:hypothetical protein
VKRSRSGQVLVAAATLMLAVLLVSAMSIPVINTDIDPSSEIYNVVQTVFMKYARSIILEMSAYQCAVAIAKGGQAHKYVTYPDNLEKLRQKMLLEILSNYPLKKGEAITVDVQFEQTPYIKVSASGWDTKNLMAGFVDATMEVVLKATITINGMKREYKYREYLVVSTKESKAKGIGYVTTHPVTEAAAEVIGFIPVIGAVEAITAFDIKGVTLKLQVSKYDRTFDSKSISNFNEEDLTKKMILFIASNNRKFKTEKPNEIYWDEVRNIDYLAIAWNVFGSLTGAKTVSKTAKILIFIGDIFISTHDTTNPDFHYSKASYKPQAGIGGIGGEFFKWINNEIKKFKQIRKVEKIEQPIGHSQDYFRYKSKSFSELKDLTKEIAWTYNRLYSLYWKKALGVEISEEYLRKLENYLARLINMLGEKSDTTGQRSGYSLAQIQLTQNTLAVFENPDPLLSVTIPLHNTVFSACIWVDGATYKSDK